MLISMPPLPAMVPSHPQIAGPKLSLRPPARRRRLGGSCLPLAATPRPHLPATAPAKLSPHPPAGAGAPATPVFLTSPIPRFRRPIPKPTPPQPARAGRSTGRDKNRTFRPASAGFPPQPRHKPVPIWQFYTGEELLPNHVKPVRIWQYYAGEELFKSLVPCNRAGVSSRRPAIIMSILGG